MRRLYAVSSTFETQTTPSYRLGLLLTAHLAESETEAKEEHIEQVKGKAKKGRLVVGPVAILIAGDEENE